MERSPCSQEHCSDLGQAARSQVSGGARRVDRAGGRARQRLDRGDAGADDGDSPRHGAGRLILRCVTGYWKGGSPRQLLNVRLELANLLLHIHPAAAARAGACGRVGWVRLRSGGVNAPAVCQGQSDGTRPPRQLVAETGDASRWVGTRPQDGTGRKRGLMCDTRQSLWARAGQGRAMHAHFDKVGVAHHAML